MPISLAETITFSDMGITAEFSSGRSGSTPIGTFYATSNEYPLEVTVNAYWRNYYRIIVFVNNAQGDSGKIIGNVNFTATILKENINIGKNTIYVKGNPWGGYPFGAQFGNFIIYGDSKISSPDIFLPRPTPAITPTITPTPTPTSAPTPTSTPIPAQSLTPATPLSITPMKTQIAQIVQIAPISTVEPAPIQPYSQENIAVPIIFLISVISFYIYKKLNRSKSITNKSEPIFGNIINFLNTEAYFRYGKNKVEKDYQQDLEHRLSILTERYGYYVKYEATEGKHRIDFVIANNVGIEMKVHRGGTQVEKELFYQMTKYGRLYPKIIGLVLNDSDKDNQELKEEIELRLRDQNILNKNDYEIIVKEIMNRY